jgi:hypothetical protein
MQTTYLLLLVLLASATLVMSVATSTYSFTFEIALTGPIGACSNADLEIVARRLTRLVGLTINLYLSNQGYTGEVTNVTLTTLGNARFLGEANNDEATAKDVVVEDQIDDVEVRQVLALFTWKTGGAAICRLCPPLDADARRELRGLQTSTTISKSKISAFLNARITSPTQNIIKRLNTTDKCNESDDDWNSTFAWT